MQVQQQGQSTGTHSIKGTHPFNLTPVKSLCFSVQLHISCYCVYCKYIDLLEYYNKPDWKVTTSFIVFLMHPHIQ